MSLTDENRMLHILHKRSVSRENIKIIMEDLKKSGIFEAYDDYNDYDDDWKYLEEEADALFRTDIEGSEKIEIIRGIKRKKEEEENSQYVLEQEKRIKNLRDKFIEEGEIEADPQIDDEENEIEVAVITRYGRTPLHEAIAMKDIKLVKKYIKNKKYLNKKDNNGHTPIEMAYYENCEEILELFEKM